MSGSARSRFSAAVIAVLLGAVLATPAHAATFPVPCGDTSALAATIVAANATDEADTIDVLDAPCTFPIETAAETNAITQDDTGLPAVTSSLTIEGHSATIARSSTATTPFRIMKASGPGADLTLNDLTVANGNLAGGNAGAGIAVVGGRLTMQRSQLNGNSADRAGGLWVSGGDATIKASLISANQAVSEGGAALLEGGTIEFTNSTVSGNRSQGPWAGLVLLAGRSDVAWSTFADNDQIDGRHGFSLYSAHQTGGIFVANSVIATSDMDPNRYWTRPCDGLVTDLGGNVESPGECFANYDYEQTVPIIAPLAMNGGPTPTHRLLPASQAIDHTDAGCPATDQRGVPRPDGAGCDAGAFETPSPETVTVGPDPDPRIRPILTLSSPDTPDAMFECLVDDGQWPNDEKFEPCSSPYAPHHENGGEVIVRIRAIHPQGYLDETPVSLQVRLDTTPPAGYLTFSSHTADETPTVDAYFNEPASLRCSVDDGQSGFCTAPYTTPPLAHGDHVVHIRAEDAFGNAKVYDAAIFVDTAPPVTIAVPCGDVDALRSAIASADATLAADTIEVQNGPCRFVLGSALPQLTRSLTIEGGGATLELQDARPGDIRVINTKDSIWDDSKTTIVLHNLKITATAGTYRYAVYADGSDVELDHVTVFGSPSSGGAVVWSGHGRLTVVDSTFDRISSPLSTLTTSGSTVRIKRSTFRGNTSTVSGIATFYGGQAELTDVTFSGNASASGSAGILADDRSKVVVASSTFAENGKIGSTEPGAAIEVSAESVVRLAGSIITDSDQANNTSPPQCLVRKNQMYSGSLINEGGNIQWPGSSCGSAKRADPLLAPFADNGGPTLTHALLPGSPAIDLAGALCGPFDQRGASRAEGDACDAGAYEATVPETSAVFPAEAAQRPSITFSSPDAALFECRIDGGAFSACTSPYAPVMTDGNHTISVRAVDAAGFADPSPASGSVSVDLTPPVVTITRPPATPSYAVATVEFADDGTAARYECAVDGGARTPCASPFQTAPQSEGRHSLTVYGTDAAGNMGQVSTTWGVSLSEPETTITGGPSGMLYDQTSATFTFTSSKANSAYQCRLGGIWNPCRSPKTVSNYGEGEHVFEVRAVDIGGRGDSTPATRTFTYKNCPTIYRDVGGVVICK